jgi:catechol 2,3-dioxygenase-like lactoylglutathione lyase family enzyme
MIRTFGLTHVALRVSDPERSVRFYEQVFGAVVIYRDANFVQAQTPGSRDVLVFERGAGGVGTSGGIAHFGFRLVQAGDIGAAREAVIGAGGTITDEGDFVPGEPYLFCRDLDGYEVEIWYELPTPVDPRGA